MNFYLRILGERGRVPVIVVDNNGAIAVVETLISLLSA